MVNSKKRFKKMLLFLLFTLLLNFFITSTRIVRAQEGEYTLNIIKYQLSDAQLNKVVFPPREMDDVLLEIKDQSGKTLVLKSGVKYQIEKVIANHQSNSFERVSNFQTQIITTNASGKASLSLGAGIYRVSEQANQEIKNPAAPIIVELPMPLQNGTFLNEVYIYPKSGVVIPEIQTPKKQVPLASSKKTIPDTALSIESPIVLYFFLALSILAAVVSLFMGKKTRKKE